jgi:hypothetical protein
LFEYALIRLLYVNNIRLRNSVEQVADVAESVMSCTTREHAVGGNEVGGDGGRSVGTRGWAWIW